MSSRRAARIRSVNDGRRQARRALPRVLYDYIEGGADDELTVFENEHAFRALALRPRMGVDSGEPSIATTVLGLELAMPILLAPCGFVQLVHPDGAVGVARAAYAAGTAAILSKIALCAPDEVAKRSKGPRWFQVNSAGGRDEVADLMDRAATAAFTGLVVTLDGPPPGNHERDLLHGVVPPVRVTPRLLSRLGCQALLRPRWTVGTLASGHVWRGQARTVGTASTALKSSASYRSARLTWSDIEWIKNRWQGYVIVKGLLAVDDAIAARESGADAIIVSNHGGRQLDGVSASIRVLPEIVAAVGESTPILVDGGVRRATDVIKALCLGAQAVLIGRPFLYGLAAAGQPGVERILEIFRNELLRNLRLMGCAGLNELSDAWLEPASTHRVTDRLVARRIS